MATFKSSVPTHLSIFVTDPDTGRPVARLPLYAEVAVPRMMPIAPVNPRLDVPLDRAFEDVDPTAYHNTAVRDRVRLVALPALFEVVDETSRNQINQFEDSFGLIVKLFSRVFTEVLATSNRDTMADIPPADLKPLIISALRQVVQEFGLGMIPEVEDSGIIWADPLGVLTTDHVGYASFDLRRLRPDVQIALVEAIEARRNDPDAVPKLAIWVYPSGHPGRFDALSQARFAFDAIVARFTMTWNTLPPALINMGPRALQNPSLTDWRLSPASFAASPKSLIGENGCEELFPANLALQEFVLRQVVRLTDVPDGFGVPRDPEYKAAYIDEYKVSWFSLGHSLGEILYSLPLAPGETVKLAEIDWSWDSLTKRDETTTLSEEVLHQTHRDRTITETVKAGIKELQSGSSFMAGKAHSGGASVGANLEMVGLGGAAGSAWSLGGSTASSKGSRHLSAENVQRLNDSFSQASSARRELYSTVVIQARQEEKQSIQTRTFSNYNRSHTLTILYYEVLRHFRVTVEWVRRRQAVLIELDDKLFDDPAVDQIALENRTVLQAALLDSTRAEGFDALDRIASRKAATSPSEDARKFRFFEFDMLTGGIVLEMNQRVEIKATLWPIEKKLNNDGILNPVGGFHDKEQNVSFAGWSGGDIDASEIDQVQLDINIINQRSGIDLALQRIKIMGVDPYGQRVTLVDKNYRMEGGDLRIGNTATLSLPLVADSRPQQPPGKSADEIEDERRRTQLIDHLKYHAAYYSAAIQFGQTSEELARDLSTKTYGSSKLLDFIEPTPLSTIANYVAYPLAKQETKIDDSLVVEIAAGMNSSDPIHRQWAVDQLAGMGEQDQQYVLERLPLASVKSERLISMPTRGVFAEGKLGHCNISEEIDNTRFWKWDEHPIPIQAPDINPVTA
jgi:hypothetical protein